MNDAGSLPIVDARQLDAARRAALKPGEVVSDARGRLRRLPYLFYEVASWQIARETELAPNFGVWEFLDVDLHEAAAVRTYPRYLPCTALLLASALSALRQHLRQSLWISANGGYRSPSHAKTYAGSTHCWGTAADLYRAGDESLDTPATIERVAAAVTRAAPGLWPRPLGEIAGGDDDHLHVDLGYSTFVPPHTPGE